jgi:hypothetical protein
MARLGPEINSQACLCVPQGPRHSARCFPIQHFIFILIFCLETTKNGLRPSKSLTRTTPSKPVSDFISSHSGVTWDPKQPHGMPGVAGTYKLLTDQQKTVFTYIHLIAKILFLAVTDITQTTVFLLTSLVTLDISH